MSNASDRRYAALKTVSKSIVWQETFLRDGEFHLENVWTEETHTAVAERIRELAKLGRTERWVTAIEDWAVAVETADSPETFQWAALQYGVWASHAAE